MATVDMHRKFGEVWHVVSKICKQTYKQAHSVANVQLSIEWYRTVFYIAFKSRMFGLFAWVCLAQNYCLFSKSVTQKR